MFKKSKSKVLVDEVSEEDDVSWHQEHANKDKESEGTEEVLSPSAKDSKIKKVKSMKSMKDRGDKKLFPSEDDEDFLLTGVTLSNRKGAPKKSWEEEKCRPHSEKNRVHCLWDSITMTMKQIGPNQKMDKMEGWEPPQVSEEPEGWREVEGKKRDPSPLSTPLSISLPGPLSLPSWTGLGPEEDSSRYSSLAEPQAAGPAQWAARARDKLAAVRRRSPGSLSEKAWEGLK